LPAIALVVAAPVAAASSPFASAAVVAPASSLATSASTSPLGFCASPVDLSFEADLAPEVSIVTNKMASLSFVPTFRTKNERTIWAKAHLPPSVYLQLHQPFGKDSIRQSFTVPAAFRHVLCLLYKSNFLSARGRKRLGCSYVPARRLEKLLRTHELVDFATLREPIPTNMPSSRMIPVYSAMFTALALHYDLDIAAAVRWLGGTHTGEHRDHEAILTLLEEGGVDADVCLDLRRIYLSGSPSFLNAESSEENFRAYLRYGNHKTIDEDPQKTMKALSKDVKRGYNIVLHPLLTFLIPHLHRTPVGMVDLAKIFKNPRPIFDSSFRPFPWCFAIND
jgi:hypothetical protein